jgi:hypothetical protein
MFEKIGRVAENAANSVSMSRRGFLGRLGKAALAAAGVVGGLAALSQHAWGGPQFRCQCHKQNFGCPNDQNLNACFWNCYLQCNSR